MVSEQNILLDPDIRDWVVLPLFVIMVSAGLLRVHVSNYLRPAPKSMTKVEQRTVGTMKATSTLKTGAIHYLSTSKLESRKIAYPEILKHQAEWCEQYLDEEERAKKARLESGDPSAADDDDMPNPLAQMEGMKGGMVSMVQNMVMMQGIQYFFSGFILLKVPFALTVGFKQMFQRGLEGLTNLDTSYVSSVSLYFLFMYGLRALFRLAMGSPTLEMQEMQKMWQKMGMKPGGGQPNGPDDEAHIKSLNQESDNLELILPKQFKSNLDQVERRLLKSKYPKKKGTLGKNDDFLLHSGSKKTKKNN